MQLVFGLFFVLMTLMAAGLAINRPHWAFALVMLMFPLKQVLQTYIPQVVLYGWAFSGLIAGVTAVAVAVRLVRERFDLRSFWNPVTGCTYGLFAMVFVGVAYTPSPDTARSLISGNWPYIVMFMVFVPLLLRSVEDFRRTILPTVVMGGMVGLGILLNPAARFQGGRLVLDIGREFGVGDYVGNPLAVADLGAVITIMAALLVPVRAGAVVNVMRIAGICLGLGIAVASGSRGQVIAAALVGVLLYPMARQVKDVKQFFLTAGGVGVLAGFLLVIFQAVTSNANIADRWSQDFWASGGEDRVQRSLRSLTAYMESPGSWLQGLGTNAYTAYVPKKPDVAYEYPHNLTIEIVTEYGVIGTVFYVVATILTGLMGWRLWKLYREDKVGRSAVVVLLGLTLAAWLIAHKQGTFIGLCQPFVWYVVLARIAKEELSRAGQPVLLESGEGYEESAWGDPEWAEGYSAGYAESDGGAAGRGRLAAPEGPGAG